MKGQIIKILSDIHYVSYDNKVYPCKCRGLFRKDKLIPVVGDYVIFDIEQQLITEILPRKNTLLRPMVSNIDQGFIVTSLTSPDFSCDLLNKLIVVMECSKVKPIICITKKDLLEKGKYKKIKPYINYYKKIGYTVVFNHQLRKIKRLFKDKTTVFTGQTGAGKSSLLNKLDPNLEFEVGEISVALGRGKHTTRHIELVELFDGKVLDTPGFSSLDFKDFTKDEIREAFVEFSNYSCPYKDCFHDKEEECLVKKAVSNKEILESRYETYLKLIKQGR